MFDNYKRFMWLIITFSILMLIIIGGIGGYFFLRSRSNNGITNTGNGITNTGNGITDTGNGSINMSNGSANTNNNGEYLADGTYYIKLSGGRESCNTKYYMRAKTCEAGSPNRVLMEGASDVIPNGDHYKWVINKISGENNMYNLKVVSRPGTGCTNNDYLSAPDCAQNMMLMSTIPEPIQIVPVMGTNNYHIIGPNRTDCGNLAKGMPCTSESNLAKFDSIDDGLGLYQWSIIPVS